MLRMKPTRAKLIHPIENCPNGTIVVKNSTKLVGSVYKPVIVDNVEKASYSAGITVKQMVKR